MHLRPIEPDEFELVAGWLADERNSVWLDFGGGRRSVGALGLKAICQRDLHCLRVFLPDESEPPVGLVALSNVDHAFRTAEVWCVLGRKGYGPQDLTVRAVAALLEHGFMTMDLQAIFAWTVEGNRGSLRLLDRLGFTQVGRRRRCHAIEGELRDRLLFDLLAEEFQGFTELPERKREGRRSARALSSATERER
jgi:RimJ/RimL family protein N-acetyltransferase